MVGLTPKQKQITDTLFSPGHGRPSFDVDLGRRLHDHMESLLRDSAPSDLGDRKPLYINKYALTNVHGCEKRWAAGDSWDGWSVEKIRGTVSHRVVEQMIMKGKEIDPLTAVHHTLERMQDTDQPMGSAQFLSDLDDEERHDLVAFATSHTSNFMMDFPPIKRQWLPRVESSLTYDRLLGGAVTLKAKYDLALGRPDGTVARVLIVDMKTGRIHASDAADLRFYALVETLRRTVPPFRVASYYTENGAVVPEDVTEGLLYQAADRVADAVANMWAIETGIREPTPSPSGLCPYCPLYSMSECGEGLAFIEEREA